MGELVVRGERICPDEAEKMSRAWQATLRAHPLHDVEPACREPAIGDSIADRSQPDADGIGDRATSDPVANPFNGDIRGVIHIDWIIPVIMDCQPSTTDSFQFFWHRPTNCS